VPTVAYPFKPAAKLVATNSPTSSLEVRPTPNSIDSKTCELFGIRTRQNRA
jgi:hypothetical protein